MCLFYVSRKPMKRDINDHLPWFDLVSFLTKPSWTKGHWLWTLEECDKIDFWAYLIAISIVFGKTLVHGYTGFLESKKKQKQ